MSETEPAPASLNTMKIQVEIPYPTFLRLSRLCEVFNLDFEDELVYIVDGWIAQNANTEWEDYRLNPDFIAVLNDDLIGKAAATILKAKGVIDIDNLRGCDGPDADKYLTRVLGGPYRTKVEAAP